MAREYGWSGFRQTVRTTISVDPANLRRFAGVWRADVDFTVGVRGDHLFVEGGPFVLEAIGPRCPAADELFSSSPAVSTFDFDPANPVRVKMSSGIEVRLNPPSGPSPDAVR